MNANCLQPGAFGWNELMTTEVAAARRFSGALFGWETEDYPVEGAPYTLVLVGSEPVGGLLALPPEGAGIPPGWSVDVTVDEVDATAPQVEVLSGKLLFSVILLCRLHHRL